MATKSLLFLGYGFGDPNILAVLYRLKERLGRPRREHYALVSKEGEMSQAWSEMGISIVRLSDFYAEHEDWTVGIKHFLEELTGRSRSISITNLERART